MNLIVNSTALAQELRLINHVVQAKPALPILANVLVRASVEMLHFYATDQEIGFSTSCRASVTEVGNITLPAKRLLDIVEQLPNADVQIVTEKQHVRIICGAFKSRLQTMSADDFPGLATASPDTRVIPRAQLHTMINRVRYAISDKTKYVVNGALFTLTDKIIALVATDGKRLSLATLIQKGELEASVIIPTKTLDALLALFTDDTITFSHTNRNLFFASDDRLLISRTFDAKFPSYERIIPRTNDKRITIDRASFAASLRRVGLLSDMNHAITLTFDANALLITSSSADAGDALERLPVVYEGTALKLCVNWEYMLNFLDAAVEPSITIDLKDATTPLLMTDGTTFVNVVMLMRV